MSRRAIQYTVLACIVAAACLASGERQPRHAHLGFEIVGSEPFVGQVQDALTLIERHAPGDLKVIGRYVKRIEQHDRSGMDNYQDLPTCQLTPSSALASVTWCAGCIAHEAHHSKLFHGPKYSYGGAEEELACNAFQQRVLERIGAPPSELAHLAAQDGGHFDLDGDGRYTWADYYKRTW